MKKNPPRSRSKRPTATINLKAKEVQKDTPAKGDEKSTLASTKASTAKSGMTRTSQTAAASKSSTPPKSSSARPAAAKTTATSASTNKNTPKDSGVKGASNKTPGNSGSAKTPPPPSSSSNGGGFLSHLVASVLGAVMGIFGLTYANNQNLLPQALQMSGGSAVNEKIGLLERKIGSLETLTTSKDANSVTNRLASLNDRLEKTEAGLGSGKEGSPSLAEKVARLQAVMDNLEQAAKTGKGGTLAGLTAVTSRLATSNKQALALETEIVKLREEQTTFRQDLASVRSSQADFQSTSAKISDEIAKMKNSTAKVVADASRPPDVSAQIDPVVAMLGGLTAKIDGVMKREAGSKAEGRNIALALSLGELKRAVSEGSPYEAELARVVPHTPVGVDLGVLSAHADKGLVTIKALRSEFSVASNAALSAENTASSGSFVDQILANAKSMVQVRPTGLVEGDTTGAVLSRMDYKLDRNDLAGSLKESEALGEGAARIMQPWLNKAHSRLGGDTVLRALEDKIRNSLAGSGSQ